MEIAEFSEHGATVVQGVGACRPERDGAIIAGERVCRAADGTQCVGTIIVVAIIGGVDGQGSVISGQRLIEAAERCQCGTTIGLSSCVGGIGRDCCLQTRKGKLGLAELGQRNAAIDQQTRMSRCELQRPVIGDDGIVQPSGVNQRRGGTQQVGKDGRAACHGCSRR